MRNKLTLRIALLTLAAAAVIPAAQPTLTTLYNFTDVAGDAGGPNSTLAIDSNGVLYGTAVGGGAFNGGTVYAVTPPASPGGSWTEAVIYSFTGYADGDSPSGGLTVGPDGVLYGVTTGGGSFTFGAFYSLTPPSSPGGSWTETVLHNFNSTEAHNPVYGLSMGANGVLYGASFGGSYNAGVVFSFTPPDTLGGPWTENLLYNFSGGADGAYPNSGVVVGPGGVLYGVTSQGGTGGAASCNNQGGSGCGVVYSLTPAGDGSWTESVLFNFNGANNGRLPAGLIIDANGNLYGSVFGGVYSLAPPTVTDGNWTHTMLHVFPGQAFGTASCLALGPEGAIFGLTLTSPVGGKKVTGGTVFSLSPPASAGGAWTNRTIWLFAPLDNPTATGGSYPQGLIVAGTPGGKAVLYGATFAGSSTGAYNDGIVFSIQP